MSDTNRPKDRRLHPRVPVEGHVELGGDAGRAVLVDISMSGLACLSSRAFDEMAVLEMGMSLPFEGGPKPLKVGGAVVRCEARDDAQHLVAVFFTHMDDDSRALLKAYVDQLAG